MLQERAKALLLAMIVLGLTACVNDPAARDRVVSPPEAPAAATLTVRLAAPQVAALADESRASLSRSPVPMFVLPAQYAQRSVVMDGEQWSALNYHDDEITISLHATNGWHDAVDQAELAEIAEPNSSARGIPAWETVNEAIRSLAWNEGDVAYALEIECARPEQDVRCTEGAFLSALATSLVPAHEGGAR